MDASQPPIRVVIAEDNGDLATALCALFEQEPDLQVTATVGRCEELPGVLHRDAAQVIVLDLDLGGQSSVTPLQALRREIPGLGVVVYSGYDYADVSSALPRLGTSEYVSKSADPAELLAAIRRAARISATASGTAGAAGP